MSGISAYEAMIRHWLSMEPALDADDFAEQAAEALWLEERYFRNWAEILKKLMGG
jgi:alpha-glucuronidase